MTRLVHKAIENQVFCLDLAQAGVDPKRFESSVQRVNRRLGISWKSPGRESPVYFDSSGGKARLRFSGIAGYLELAGIPFVIVPKYSSCPKATDEFIDLLPIAVTFEPSCVSIDPRGVRAQRLSLRMRDLIGAYFADQVSRALRSQPLRMYQRVQERRSSLRGRLLTGQHLRSLPHQRHQLPCDFSAFTQDNPIVGLLRWCATELRRMSSLSVVRRRLAAVEAAILPVPFDVAGPLPKLESVPASASEYREPVRLALAVARGKLGAAPGTQTTRVPISQTASVLVLTHKAFQGLVSAVMTQAVKPLGLTERRQQTKAYAQRLTDNRKRYLMPDEILVDGAGSPIMVGDAKYVGRSEHSNGIESEHFYQVSSAARAFGVRSALIVAPRIEGVGDEFEEWELVHGAVEDTVVIGVYRLDVRRMAAEPGGVIENVTEALSRITRP